MRRLKRTDSGDSDFRDLVRQLDADLAVRNGDQNDFFAQFNTIDAIKNAVVCYEGDVPVGCGAFKPFDAGAVEIKRMYVKPEFRGAGIGAAVLAELEAWAAALQYADCVLETGKMNPEALSLYKKKGYEVIPNFGQYEGVADSVCMKKALKGSR